jgi:AcrR family transcriptional regulator
VTVQPEKSVKGSIKGEIAEFKRKQILDAAVELFLRNGYHGTSVDAIASVLGVSKQFVYYQFKDKPAILNGVCTTGAELTLSAITDSLPAPDRDRDRPREVSGCLCQRSQHAS